MNTPSLKKSQYKVASVLHIEHLSIELNHLLLIQERHLKWSKQKGDPSIRNLHQNIAESLGQTAQYFEELLETLELEKNKY